MLTSNFKGIFFKSKYLIFDVVVSQFLLRHAYSTVPLILSKNLVPLEVTNSYYSGPVVMQF